MRTEPILAIAVSARDWPDALRQTVADHGGGRVRLTAMARRDLEGEEFDVLLIDDICSFLDRALVVDQQVLGRVVIGVHDDEVGREHLEALGVDSTIDASASAAEFVHLVGRVGPRVDRSATRATDIDVMPPTTVVSGISGGVGTTEIALALAAVSRGVVVDLADVPSVAQRVGLAIHPNIATAAEAVDHGTGGVGPSVQWTNGVGVIAGTVQPPRLSLPRIARALASVVPEVVIDNGTARASDLGWSPERSIIVASATPVGVTRLLDRLGVDGRTSHVVLNRSPRSRYQRAELAEVVGNEVEIASLTFLPEDPRVGLAAWNGTLVGAGRFRSGIAALAGATRQAA